MEKELDAPYTIDIALGKTCCFYDDSFRFSENNKALFIVTGCARNDDRATGADVLMFTHMK